MTSTKGIDAHQHFWRFDPIRDSWITDDMKVIQRDFMPEDLQPLLEENGFDGCVVVQSDQSEEENNFQLENAEKHSFIKGVIGWVDFQAADIEDRLSYYQLYDKLKGFRHILQGEKDRAYMLNPKFKQGIQSLNKFGYTYDILIFPDQLDFTREFVDAFPSQLFVIDHMAKPNINGKEITDWKRKILKIAAHENVYCKVSGMVTEADWQKWKKEDFAPYLEAIVEAFGMKRIMFGSDWPVCNVAASYKQVVDLVKDYFSSFTTEEQDLFFGGNAIKFYGL